MSKLVALLIGDFRCEEFRAVRKLIRRDGTIHVAPDIPQAQRLISHLQSDQNEPQPDLVIFACQWPGQFAHRDLYALKRQLPLARFLSVLGAWCEGETRTGAPWPGMLRTYWHHGLPYWSGQLRRFLEGRVTSWGLQQTATEDERSLLAPIAARNGNGIVLVKSESYDMAEMLCQACRAYGYGSVWTPPAQQACVAGVVAVLWNAAEIDWHRIAMCRSKFPDAPMIALTDFPRAEEARRAIEAGVSLVMGKPLNVDDLFGQLWQLIDSGQNLSAGLKSATNRREVA